MDAGGPIRQLVSSPDPSSRAVWWNPCTHLRHCSTQRPGKRTYQALLSSWSLGPRHRWREECPRARCTWWHRKTKYRTLDRSSSRGLLEQYNMEYPTSRQASCSRQRPGTCRNQWFWFSRIPCSARGGYFLASSPCAQCDWCGSNWCRRAPISSALTRPAPKTFPSPQSRRTARHPCKYP